jgi:hypothetical protein
MARARPRYGAKRVYRDRRTGQRRRHHLHEPVLQRPVTDSLAAQLSASPRRPS